MCKFFVVGFLLLQALKGESTHVKDAMAGHEFDTRLKYPYELPVAKKRELLTKMTKLRRGDSIRDVVKLLGPPINQRLMAAKEKTPKVRGVVATYYLKEVGWGTNEIQDQVIYLVYDTDLHLTRIDTNIKGLKFDCINGRNSELVLLEDEAFPVRTKPDK